MKKLMNRKGDGLSTIVISIIFIILILLTVPAFRGMQSDNTTSIKGLASTTKNFTDEGIEDSVGSGYNLNSRDWTNGFAD
ncbi:hypothetical protein [Alkaliphilus sp. B6464]|uniref:hypothetical protein n=1 Tax=Alkaliphilus sp. B6464 TaxID=2731219 RepID=UPI001BAD1349|nr:hypothetical protein [Alkaliphilus sp. B6464]QUH22002.1 hypothetical protein HYG84_19040 [Alkaliphilus sp. B6464]